MEARELASKIADWSLGSIIGSAAVAASALLASLITGSWGVMLGFTEKHAPEAAVCCLVVLAVGAVIGIMIRHGIAVKREERLKEEASREIDQARKEIDRLVSEAKKVPELIERAEEAERRYSETFSIKLLDPRQIHVVYDCYAAASGRTGHLLLDWDNTVARSLVQAGVLYAIEERTEITDSGIKKTAYRLTTGWYRFVSENEEEFAKAYAAAEDTLISSGVPRS